MRALDPVGVRFDDYKRDTRSFICRFIIVFTSFFFSPPPNDVSTGRPLTSRFYFALVHTHVRLKTGPVVLGMYNIMATCDAGTEPYESWEALDDPSVLSTQIKKMQLASATKSENNSKVVILPPGLQLYNHQQMTNYPQQPTVKILKRPQKDTTANENADKPKVQVKSLEQRKQEYAEARLRIMGEEHEEDLNADDEGASSSGSSKFEVFRQPIVRTIVEDNVIRQPRGPDNTKGFNHRS